MVAQLRRRREVVAPGEEALDARGERGVDREDVLHDARAAGTSCVITMAPVSLLDARAHLARPPLDERRARSRASVEDRGARLLHARGAQRVGLAGPAERWEAALAALEERRRRPARAAAKASRTARCTRGRRARGRWRRRREADGSCGLTEIHALRLRITQFVPPVVPPSVVHSAAHGSDRLASTRRARGARSGGSSRRVAVVGVALRRLLDDDARRRRARRHPREARRQRPRRAGHAGRHRAGSFYNPLTEQIVLFPTSVQNVVWTQSAHEGKPFDESITFSSVGGRERQRRHRPVVPHRADARAEALRALPAERPREARPTATCATRCARRSTTSPRSSPVQDIYGAGKSKMLADVTQKCRDVFGKDGIVIDQLTINGTLRLPAERDRRHQPRHGGDAEGASRAATASPAGRGRGDAGHHAGARRGRGGAAEGAGRGRRAAHHAPAPRRRPTRSSASRRRRRCSSTARSSTGTASSPSTTRRSCRCSRSTSSKGGAAHATRRRARSGSKELLDAGQARRPATAAGQPPAGAASSGSAAAPQPAPAPSAPQRIDGSARDTGYVSQETRGCGHGPAPRSSGRACARGDRKTERAGKAMRAGPCGALEQSSGQPRSGAGRKAEHDVHRSGGGGPAPGRKAPALQGDHRAGDRARTSCPTWARRPRSR